MERELTPQDFFVLHPKCREIGYSLTTLFDLGILKEPVDKEWASKLFPNYPYSTFAPNQPVHQNIIETLAQEGKPLVVPSNLQHTLGSSLERAFDYNWAVESSLLPEIQGKERENLDFFYHCLPKAARNWHFAPVLSDYIGEHILSLLDKEDITAEDIDDSISRFLGDRTFKLFCRYYGLKTGQDLKTPEQLRAHLENPAKGLDRFKVLKLGHIFERKAYEKSYEDSPMYFREYLTFSERPDLVLEVYRRMITFVETYRDHIELIAGLYKKGGADPKKHPKERLRDLLNRWPNREEPLVYDGHSPPRIYTHPNNKSPLPW